ncbi:MAG: hypothetical protein AAF911_00815 [Planctomycetota bacterium]
MTEDTGPLIKTSEDRLPWRGIAVGGGLLLALFVAAPFIQIWIDSIPRYEQRPALPLAVHNLNGDSGVVSLRGDGQFVAAAPNRDDYVHYYRLHEVSVHSEDPDEAAEAEAEIESMYDEGRLIKLMGGAELTIVNGERSMSRVEVTSGRNEGAGGWLANQFIREVR